MVPRVLQYTESCGAQSHAVYRINMMHRATQYTESRHTQSHAVYRTTWCTEPDAQLQPGLPPQLQGPLVAGGVLDRVRRAEAPVLGPGNRTREAKQAGPEEHRVC